VVQRLRDFAPVQTLDKIHELQEGNKVKLVHENTLLKAGLRSSWSFTVMLWMLLVTVGTIFFFAYAVIRLFPLR
jgi:hypothetical protein